MMKTSQGLPGPMSLRLLCLAADSTHRKVTQTTGKVCLTKGSCTICSCSLHGLLAAGSLPSTGSPQ